MIEKNKVYSFDDLKEAYESYITIPKDRKLIEDAYAFADNKHKGQVRKSGDPYIVHPIAVAYFWQNFMLDLKQLQLVYYTILKKILGLKTVSCRLGLVRLLQV